MIYDIIITLLHPPKFSFFWVKFVAPILFTIAGKGRQDTQQRPIHWIIIHCYTL